MTDWEASRLVAQTEGKVHWVNLQYGTTIPYIAQIPQFETWEDTAAAIDICDLVVSVDTGPMHLAHSLGKPVWLILSGNSDWKWMLSGQSPWYKEMRIFRNNGERGYHKAIAELTSALLAGEADCFNGQKRLPANA